MDHKSETPNLSLNYPKLRLRRRVGLFNLLLGRFGFCNPRLSSHGITSFLLDEGIAKICKKFNSHNGFLRTDQGRAKNNCQIGFRILQVSSKSHCEISISCIFLQSPHQVEMRNIVKCFKGFFLAFQYSRNIPCRNVFCQLMNN